MKQYEIQFASLGAGVAKLQELSFHNCTKIPALTLMNPASEDYPATSFYVDGDNVKSLYELLKQYYEEPT